LCGTVNVTAIPDMAASRPREREVFRPIGDDPREGELTASAFQAGSRVTEPGGISDFCLAHGRDGTSSGKALRASVIVDRHEETSQFPARSVCALSSRRFPCGL